MAEAKYVVFINHRVADELDFVYRIRDKFVAKYGEDRVFMAPDSIRPPADSDKFLEEALNSTHVLVAIVGPKWEDLFQKKSTSGEEDWVRKEIKFALDNEIVVAPVCIKRDQLPSRDSVPCDIWPMLKPQFSFVQGNQNFHRDVDKLISDIEAGLNSFGFSSSSSSDIGRLLSRDPKALQMYLVRQIDEGNVATIRQNLRDLPGFLIDSAANLDSDQTDTMKSLGEGISVLGTVFLVHGQPDLFNKFLQSLEQVCTLAYRRFQNENHKKSAIWNEVLKILYYLGALAIRESKSKQLSSLMQLAVKPLPLDSKPRHWFTQLQRNRAGSLQEYNRLLFDILSSIETAKFPYSQFSNDAEVLISHLCQCDFIHCLFLDLVAETHRSGAWPFFAVDYFERLSPILDTLINDSQYRTELFDVEVSDANLAFAIARYCGINRTSTPPFRSFWHQRPWENGIPMHVKRFLRDNLPESNQNYFECLGYA